MIKDKRQKNISIRRLVKYINISDFHYILLIVFIAINLNLYSQIENVPTTNPVYSFFINQEAKGLLPHFSTAQIPWSKSKVIEALKLIDNRSAELSTSENKALKLFETEFGILKRNNAVVFYSQSDSNQVLFSRLFTDDEKFIYYYQDSSDNVSLFPLGNLDFSYIKNDTSSAYALIGNLGIRLSGSIGEHFGFFLQATNGTLISGERWVALNDNRLKQNIKFADLNSDIDFTESHISLEYDWFRAVFGRQTRYVGSGIYQKLFLSSTSPPMDGLDMSANFSNFNYTFSIYNLLGRADSLKDELGFLSKIPVKLSSMHRLSLRPAWGELTFWESVIYSDRGFDLSYLNPLSFLKSLEHANHDRDNSLMGLDWTIRPWDHFQINGSFLLDDIIFSEIGSGYWSNKLAYNISFSHSSEFGMLGLEYSRVEPYTYTHFNPQNSYTNDHMLIGSYILPNSDMLSFIYRFYFLGNRYPWMIRVAYERHGDNIYDNSGNLVKNVGSDPFVARRSEDAYYIKFLDGKRNDAAIVELEFGYEIIRGFNLSIQAFTKFSEYDNSMKNIRIKFSYLDF